MTAERDLSRGSRRGRRYSITIPVKDILSRADVAASGSKWKAFRPGKIPSSMVRKMHGPDIADLTKEVQDGIASLIEQHNLEIATRKDAGGGNRDTPDELHVEFQFATRPNYAPKDEASGSEKAHLLALAVSDETTDGYARDTAQDEIRAAAIDILGGAKILGMKIKSEEDLIQAVVTGFPSDVLNSLRDAGWPAHTLEKVVAPKRTLMRRKSGGQRLTAAESDGAWRLAATLALAARVLNGPAAALAWLARPKPALSGQTPVELLRSGVGAAYVQSLLNRLNWGDIA